MTKSLTKLLKLPAGAVPVGSPRTIRIELTGETDVDAQRIREGKVSKVASSAPATANAYILGRRTSEVSLPNYNVRLARNLGDAIFFPVQYYII